MVTTVHCECLSADHHGVPGTDYYATVTDGTRVAKIAGPFTMHREAMAAVIRERPAILRKYADATWYEFGTAGVRA